MFLPTSSLQAQSPLRPGGSIGAGQIPKWAAQARHRDGSLRPQLALSVLVALCFALALSACQQTTSKVLTKLSQKTAISQGNLMFREDMARLRLGMSKEEVQFILGAPLLKGSFEEDRWYYLFYLNLKPFPKVDDEHEKVVFNGAEGAKKWEEYWLAEEILERYGVKTPEPAARPEESGPGTDATGAGSDGEVEEPDPEGPDLDPGNEELAEESERITTIRRNQFVESKRAHPTGRKVVFYGRMALDFEANLLKSISLLETPDIAPGGR